MRRRGPKDLVIVVLGGASGIGLATARAASAAGAHVVVGDVHHPAPAEPETVLTRRADVTDERSLAALRDEVLARCGRLDVVVNCAAIIEPGRIDVISVGAIRRQFEVNAIGTALVTKAFLPTFLQRRAGHFIHLASLGGIVPLPHEAAYSATKFAVRGFCLAVAEELRGTGVHVTVVCPDSTDTGQLLSEARNHGAPLSFTSRPLTPATVARAILSAVARPRREICVPARRAGLAKLAGASPLCFRLAYPILSALGERARRRYLDRRPAAAAAASRLAEAEGSP